MTRVTALGCAAIVTMLSIFGCGGTPAPTRPSLSAAGASIGVAGPTQATPVTASWSCFTHRAAGAPGIFGAGVRDAACPAVSRAPLLGSRAAAGGVARWGAAASAVDFSPIVLAGSVSGSTVTLTWTLPRGVAVSYVIEAGSSPGADDLAFFDTGSSAQTFTATSVPAGRYYVRVYPADDTYYYLSGESNEIVVTVGSTGGCTAAPNVPQNLTQSVTGSTVSLAWSAPSGGCTPTAYVLHAGSAAGSSNLANAAVGMSTSYVATGMGAGSYYIRVLAQNAYGQSAPSNEVAATVGGGLYRGHLAAGLTRDPSVIAVAADVDGSIITAVAGTGPNGVGAVTYTTPDGQESIVYPRSDGLPARAISGGRIFVFDNYTATTVDIAVIANGQISITRGIQLASLNAAAAQYMSTAFAPAGAGDILVGILKTAGVLLKAAGCGASIASGVGIPLGIACAAKSVNDIRSLISGTEIDASKDAIGIIGTLGQCAQNVLHGTALDILDCIARLKKAYVAQAELYRQVHQGDIDRALEQLRPSAGSVTLTSVQTTTCQPLPEGNPMPGWRDCIGTAYLNVTKPVTSGYVSVFMGYGYGGFYRGELFVGVGAKPGNIQVPLKLDYMDACIPTQSTAVTVFDGRMGAGTAPQLAIFRVTFTQTCR